MKYARFQANEERRDPIPLFFDVRLFSRFAKGIGGGGSRVGNRNLVIKPVAMLRVSGICPRRRGNTWNHREEERGGAIWAKTREIVGRRNVEALFRVFCLRNVQFRANSVFTFP